MSVLAICPYCQRGKIRAPESAVGLSATCPKCSNCFTIVASTELPSTPPPVRVWDSPHAPKPAEPVGVDEPTPLPVLHSLGEQDERDRTMARDSGDTAELPELTDLPRHDEASHASLIFALVAIILAGAGLALSQLPFGRFASLALGVLAVAAGFYGLFVAQRKYLWPAIGTGAGVVVLLLVLLAPSALGLYGWLPQRGDENAKQAKGMPYDGGAAQSADWVDVSKLFWQRGDVRVSLENIVTSPVELKGPNGEKQYSRDRVLQVRLRIANVGVVRKIDFRSWSERPTAEIPAPRLIDSYDRSVPAKTFEAGWQPRERITGAGIFPGKSIEDLLVFELPEKNPEFVRLELPAAAFGETENVKLHIPMSLLNTGASAPRSNPR